jgi:hypothetical protein
MSSILGHRRVASIKADAAGLSRLKAIAPAEPVRAPGTTRRRQDQYGNEEARIV